MRRATGIRVVRHWGRPQHRKIAGKMLGKTPARVLSCNLALRAGYFSVRVRWAYLKVDASISYN
jgi:hypothetical protein